ncbi:unnamed protein product [Prorocentrum cordatum]|uniref:Calpain catalytic domain-containing protein n=1 Tax=Prorocentrum cordatum TaxID=2364126 RepID=A0ABN9SCV8_9DINO|nr:unnamed protein product [Polarella glacialis]
MSQGPSLAPDGATAGYPPAPPPTKDFLLGDPGKWKFQVRMGHQIACGGTHRAPVLAESIQAAVEMMRTAPYKYFGCVYPQEGYSFAPRLYLRSSGARYIVTSVGVAQPEAYRVITPEYVPLSEEVRVDPDEHTDGILATYRGSTLSPRCPGRRQGVCDAPGCVVYSLPDPSDISQGLVGDRWLLSAISALAEFDGAIRRLFAKTDDLLQLPCDEFNRYTVTLYDLRTWNAVEVVVDERLLWDDEYGCLFGCSPTPAGELWPCVLEKAIAAHCGGWDKIDGGSCVHAWRILTGCRDACQILLDRDGLYRCYGKYKADEGRWAELENSPHDGDQQLHKAGWPEVGGGGDVGQGISADALFAKLCAWVEAGFLFSCQSHRSASRAASGVMDTHAYSVIGVIQGAGGSHFDMIKVRHPDGSGDLPCGIWSVNHDGFGWEEHPEVHEACGCPEAGGNVAWMQREDFFDAFYAFNLAPISMHDFARGWERGSTQQQSQRGIGKAARVPAAPFPRVSERSERSSVHQQSRRGSVEAARVPSTRSAGGSERGKLRQQQSWRSSAEEA